MVQEIKRFRTSPAGHIKVSSAIAFGRRQLAPLIASFLQQYPDVSVELTLTDRFADLITEGQDVVIRAAQEPRLLSLVARRLVPWRWVLCAAPSYLDKHPTPRVPQDLAEHNCLLYTSNPRGEWKFTRAGEAEAIVRVKGNFKANNADGVLQGALAGLGEQALARQAVSAIGLVVHLERADGVRRLAGFGRLRADAEGRLTIERVGGAVPLPNRSL